MSSTIEKRKKSERENFLQCATLTFLDPCLLLALCLERAVEHGEALRTHLYQHLNQLSFLLKRDVLWLSLELFHLPLALLLLLLNLRYLRLQLLYSLISLLRSLLCRLNRCISFLLRQILLLHSSHLFHYY